MDSSGGKEADTSIEKLCQVFSKFLEQQQFKVALEIIKQSIEPNPVKLSVLENYVSWVRHVKLIISSHGYENLLTVVDEEKKEWRYRKQANQ
jgi:hypothetical protein